MRTLRRALLWLLLLLGIYVMLILTYGTFTDWTPPAQTQLTAVHPGDPESTIKDSLLRLLNWNVGYGGLGAEVAFFYDQGDFLWTSPGNVRPPRTTVEKAIDGMEAAVLSLPVDLYLFQEVDTAARRSYYTHQLDSLATRRPGYTAYFALNYRNERVPIPVFQPWGHYGYVRGGLVSMSRFAPQSSVRYALPGELAWPNRLFSLDRCALRQEFMTDFGLPLVVYNVHLSAYDKDGKAKQQQMDWLRRRVIRDYEAGAYVIVGGDWNQVPPGFDYARFSPDRAAEYQQIEIPFDYAPPGWLWAYDPARPTNRKANEPYDAKKSRKSLIDFYLLSPNLRLRQVQTIEQGFAFSDHQPVYLEVELLRSLTDSPVVD